MILLDTGVVEIFTGKKKDIDISFIDEENKIIYYYEEKGNIEFDTEKLPATIHKIKLIKRYFLCRVSVLIQIFHVSFCACWEIT